MRLLYFTLADFTDEYGGVYKKILSQIFVFRSRGYEVDLIFKRAGLLMLCTDSGQEVVLGHTGGRFTRGLGDTKFLDYMRQKIYDFVYIRYPNTDFFFQSLLKIWHKNGSRIMIEFPTFPYDKELQETFIRRMRLTQDKIHRLYLKKYVNAVATYSMHTEIYGIPALHVINGIDFSKERLRNTPNEMGNDREPIHVIAVSIMHRWHGYDRFLKGMGEYYQRKGMLREIVLHLVGMGSEMVRYHELVSQYGLQTKVLFHGFMKGEELDRLYDQCSIGIETLANHRKDVFLSSSLKSREYMAKGLPMITSCVNDIFQNNCPNFVFMVKADEDAISMDDIILFYHRVYYNHNKQEVARNIRKMAEDLCGLQNSMASVISYIETGDR